MTGIVPRPRLFTLLDDGARLRVTLVQAGPGWGKTTLIRSWAEARRTNVAWLDLRPEHRDARTVVRAVGAALEPAGVVVVDDCAEDAAEPVWLVLDDFQVLDGAPAADVLAQLIDRRLDWLHVVLISRTEPRLPLHRLRAAGELTEIGPPELAFDPDEASAAGFTAASAEGWPLGLRLAAEARHPGEATRDYLLREVVAAQPPPVRRFLLRTCFPDLICADLAAALTGETHGRQILDHLERVTGFVTRPAGDPRWYRYHGQLRDALRRQFEVEEPEATAALHGLIARWFARERSMPEALRHATLAGDWAYLGRLVAEQAIAMLVSGRRDDLFAAMRGIPAEQFAATAELSLCAAVLMYADGNLPAIPARVEQARRMAAARGPSQRLALDAALGVVEAGTVIRVAGDMPGLVRATTELLDRLRPAAIEEVPALPQLRAFALTNKGVGLLWTGRLDQADQFLWSGMTAARSAGAELVEVNALGHLGLVAYLQGSLGEAADHAGGAEELARSVGMESAPQAAMAHLVVALIEIERNRIAEAQSALRRALHTGLHPPEAVSAVLTSLVRVQLLLAADDPAAARALLETTRDEGGPRLAVPRLDRWLRLTAAEVALALHQPDRVISLYPPTGRLRPAEQVCLGRAYLALGSLDKAEELLGQARNSPHMIAAVTAWIGLALVAEARGHVSRSVDAMSRAGQLARRNGIRRPFRHFDASRIEVLTGRQRWLHEVVEEAPHPAEPPALAEALSEREHDVLRFLPTVLTAGEIAGSLGISVNTVKAHMRAIYRKLGAARRREAVVRARQRGLL
ncbi:LuxR C-terminal-related transcriptional regulator [Actinoplanes sp. CA-030573]|uniref:LuxR C-terminal-related transcriptional regulator n=1 Tax=Actinoplanes sp. CA-030573 TaxID=3239898 RepID=UPI003D903116